MLRDTFLLLTLSCIGAALISSVQTTYAATSVSNTATISATAGDDGVSTNKLRIHTVVNGEVVDDVDLTSNEPIQYRDHAADALGTTSVAMSSGIGNLSTSTRQAHLQALLMQLLHYVSLLNRALQAERL